MKKYVWIFIVTVAVADIYFSWSCRASVLDWEANPVACLVCRQAGVWGAILLRVISLVYAAVMTRQPSRSGWLITPVCGLAHLYLLTLLAQSYQHLEVLAG